MNARTDLFNHLQLQSEADKPINSESLVASIYRSGVDSILFEELWVIDRRRAKQTALKRTWQKHKNRSLEEEIKSLTSACEQVGIKLIHLKGLVLAEDLYGPREMRIFDDIDVLVDITDMEAFLLVAAARGYAISLDDYGGLPIPVIDARRWLDYLQVSHYRSFVHFQLIKICSSGQAIKVEAHVNLFDPPLDRPVMTSILARVTAENRWQSRLWLLELHDRLVHLTVHFVKHYYYDICLTALTDASTCAWPNLAQLHDLALLLERYRAQWQWDTILQRAHQWQLSALVHWGFQLISEVYPGRIPVPCIESLHNQLQAEPAQFFAAPLMALSAAQALAGANVASLEGAYQFVHGLGSQLRCGRQRSPDCLPGDFEAGQHPVMPEEWHGDGWSQNLTDSCNYDCGAVGRVGWTETHFSAQVCIFDDQLVFDNQQGTSWAQDSCEFLFYDPEAGPPKLRQIRFVPHWAGDQLKCTVLMPTLETYRLGGEVQTRTLSDQECECAIQLHSGGYGVALRIPWQVLSLQVRTGKKLGVDFLVTDCDDIFLGRKKRLSWNSGKDVQGLAWCDPASLGCLILDN